MPSQTPNVFTFPRNEPGTTGHLDLIEPLRAMPNDAAAAVKGIADRDVIFRPEEGAWCAKEIIGHLRDASAVYHKRLYMMSTQTDPILAPYDPEAFAREHRYMERGIDEMLDEMRAFRADTVALLTSLVNWNWARTGQHLEDGRMSIRQIVQHMVDHEADHLLGLRLVRAQAEAQE